jgi:outer membrane protein assembly factor BamB
VFERVWTYPIHHAVGAFSIDGDDCFVATRGTQLVALTANTGERRWGARIQNPYGWLAVHQRTVFYLNQHSHLIAVDRLTGEPQWSLDLHGINGWLHAYRDRVVVGGWRGYTDVLALDADDGRACWTLDARRGQLHSTRVYAESETLVVAEQQAKRILFVRLADGEQVGECPTDGWEQEFAEHPSGTATANAPAVLDSGQNEFFVIAGTNQLFGPSTSKRASGLGTCRVPVRWCRLLHRRGSSPRGIL